MKDDHGSYIRNFCTCEQKARKKKIRLVRDSNPWPLRYQCSLIGRALHRYRRGQRFESRTSRIFFFRLSSPSCKSCVYNCDDHPSLKFLLLSLLLLLSCFVFSWKCNVLGFHWMKESEPNCNTPHRNFNSMSDETHCNKSELTVYKQRREAKSMRMIHSTLGSQSNTVCVQEPSLKGNSSSVFASSPSVL